MRIRLCLCAVLLTAPLCAQKPKAPVMERTISFGDAKPVLGLPADVGKASGLCSREGLTFFPGSADAASPRDLYSLSTTGEVRHMLRKLPVDFTDVLLKDFFPSDHTLVTLLEASNRDTPDAAPHGTEYFLSTSDSSGDGSDLLALAVGFKPLKVGVFGSGDFLLLGWDTTNELPVLARLKADGSIRRFVDTFGLQKSAGAAPLAQLSRAALVPFGDDLLLTFPGTTRPVWVMRDRGEDRSRGLSIPGGYVLRDVLGSDGHNALVFRVRAEGNADEAKTSKVPPRLFEESYLLMEYKLGGVATTAVTCAAKGSLTAVWMQAKGTPVDGTDAPVQLVVGTVRR